MNTKSAASVAVLGCLLLAPLTGARPAAQTPQAAACRAVAAQYVTQHRGRGFTATTTTRCEFDRTALEFRCAAEYRDSFGTTTTTTIVTAYASVADLIDEARVVPPLRRALSTTSVQKGSTGTTTTRLVNRYDAQGRLVSEASGQESTVYGGWDSAGRPTTARATFAGGTSTRTMAYGDHQVLITTPTPQGPISCTQVFDDAGNERSSNCLGPAGSATSSTTTITATAQICR
jgi:YD repeat-containing protein